MVTTAIFAEILIIGFQALGVIALVVATVRGNLRFDADLSGWVPLVTVLVVAAAYTLGVVADRLSDTAYRVLRLRNPRSTGMAHKRLTVMKESPGLSAFLEYQRSRLRIARATVVNLALAVLAVSALLAYRRPWTVGPATATALGLIVACAAGVVAARAIEDAYVKRLDDAFGLVTGNGEVAVQLVAAVPFARVGDRVELWIVRTRKRRADRWVFPKGHVDASDASPAEAAAREAAEEAGVRGAVDARPFTSFLYGTDDDGDGDVVTAYLLEVERADGKCEPGRDPQRVPPEEAKARLARGRPRRFARELTAVVDAAVAEIEARDSE